MSFIIFKTKTQKIIFNEKQIKYRTKKASTTPLPWCLRS